MIFWYFGENKKIHFLIGTKLFVSQKSGLISFLLFTKKCRPGLVTRGLCYQLFGNTGPVNIIWETDIGQPPGGVGEGEGHWMMRLVVASWGR